MVALAFHAAYPEAGDFSVDERDSEQADFDIGSDASDADLLELKQELNKLGPGKAQRDLAYLRLKNCRHKDGNGVPQLLRCSGCNLSDANSVCLSSRYCDFVRKDHLKLVRSCSIMSSKGHLIWYYKAPSRPEVE